MKANKIAPDGWRAGRAVINRQVDRLIGFTRSCRPHSRTFRVLFLSTTTRARTRFLSLVRPPSLLGPGTDVRPICSNSIGADGDWLKLQICGLSEKTYDSALLPVNVTAEARSRNLSENAHVSRRRIVMSYGVCNALQSHNYGENVRNNASKLIRDNTWLINAKSKRMVCRLTE